jgi:hypothetical protein
VQERHRPKPCRLPSLLSQETLGSQGNSREANEALAGRHKLLHVSSRVLGTHAAEHRHRTVMRGSQSNGEQPRASAVIRSNPSQGSKASRCRAKPKVNPR